MSKKKPEVDFSTEEKIKTAANIVFTKKGFSGTRTRDIAEEAGINLALLNYYFRSKEKLFDIVMMDNIKQFVKILLESHFYYQLTAALNDKVNTLHFIINIIGLTVFPFVASPLLKIIGELKSDEFERMVEERKKMIPMWVDAMIQAH